MYRAGTFLSQGSFTDRLPCKVLCTGRVNSCHRGVPGGYVPVTGELHSIPCTVLSLNRGGSMYRARTSCHRGASQTVYSVRFSVLCTGRVRSCHRGALKKKKKKKNVYGSIVISIVLSITRLGPGSLPHYTAVATSPCCCPSLDLSGSAPHERPLQTEPGPYPTEPSWANLLVVSPPFL
jgi:hypothetical protein